MRKPHKPSYALIGIVSILVVFGLLMLASASLDSAQKKFSNPYHYFLRQLFGLAIGVVSFLLIQKIDYRIWKRFSLLFFILSLFLLFLVFIPNLGYGAGGAKRWLEIGGFSFQPAELVKLSVLLYFASLLSQKQDKNFKRFFIPFFVVITAIGGLLILQPDISTLGIIALTTSLTYFTGGGKIKHLVILFLSGIGTLLILIKLAPYRMNRLLTFLNPEIDPQGISYQINQALIALGSGGLFGKGLGLSIQKFSYLPEVAGDSIFAIIGEELGFIGSSAIVFLFLLFAWQGFKIAKNSPDPFGRITAASITSWITLQAFVNITSISGLMPLTGIPLPFISYGGTSLAISLLSIGILVNISKYTN